MKTLILMRHAKSDWKQPGMSDHDRPLNDRGRRAAPVMARVLLDSPWKVDVVLASSAVRVQQTIELMQEVWGERVEVLTCPALYLAAPGQLKAEVQALHDSWNHALVVAHNPGLAALASQLANLSLDLPTAAVAVFQFDSPSWRELFSHGPAQLAAFWKPRELMNEE